MEEFSLMRMFRARAPGRFLRHYFIISVLLIASGLITSAFLEIYFRYHERREHLGLLQQEAAVSAALEIERFIDNVETAMKAAAKGQDIGPPRISPNYKFELKRLLHLAPPITSAAVLDTHGIVQMQLSRLRATSIEYGKDFSTSAVFQQARQGKLSFSPIYFVRGSEPYMTVAVPIDQFKKKIIGVLQAEVNLKYVWKVIAGIKVGKVGYAYAAARSGELIAHSDLSLVLQRRNLSQLPQVETAFHSGLKRNGGNLTVAHNLQGRKVITSFVYLPRLDWAVFIERPLEEMAETLYSSVLRTAILLLMGLGVALFASVFLARRVVRPLGTLRLGVERIGRGDLDFRLHVKTGDEIELVADEFNKMTAALQEAYTSMEKKVDERTQELKEALKRQTALAEVLRVMAASPTDLQAVLNTLIANAATLANAKGGVVRLPEGELLIAVATYNEDSERPATLKSIANALNSPSAAATAFRQRKPVHLHDAFATPNCGDPSLWTPARTLLAVPMIREGKPIGIISLFREVVEPFSNLEIEMVNTFADEAVVAVENVRLFRESQERSHELARSVSELQALGEISRAIGFSLDLETILTSIVKHAINLSGTDSGAVFEFDEQSQDLHLRATYKLSDELVQAIEKFHTRLGDTVVGRAVTTRKPIQVFDILEDPDYPLREILKRMGMRGILALPLMRETTVVGALVVGSKVPGQFSTATIDLLHALASQSVLAIHNARLFRNIQAQRQQLEIANEQLREIDRLKSSFLSNVSHELRTPLTAIGGIAENLLDGMAGTLNEKQGRYITGIKDSGDRLARLIDDLLDLSAIEANRIKLTPSSFSLDDLVHEVAEMLKTVADAKSVTLEVPGRNGRLMARADSDKITQVVTNLVINAVKFTPVGGKVALTLEPTNEGNWLQVNVTDSGPGIAAAEVEKIFDEFYQIGQPDREKTEGFGLGLAICKRLVEMHGGVIWVDSAPGRGSSFHFTIPAAQIKSKESSAI